MTRFTPLIFCAITAFAFPQHASLAGLSDRELADIIPRLNYVKPTPPPGPLNDTTPKLVNDKDHPWMPLREGDQRGPCPGLNTLASHGYLPRNGIATPAQIVAAVQEGFNMPNDIAVFAAYSAFLVDGNPITNLMSIGGKTALTGPDLPKPAIGGGLDTHAVFEGDASMTRGDAFFGDNHSFNETLFDQFVDFSNKFGAGKYNLTVAAELRHQRIQQSIATNPNFTFVAPRYFTAFAESAFPLMFFVDGRVGDGQVPMDVARSFFQDSRMPDGFFRPNGSIGSLSLNDAVADIFLAHQIQPGANQGGVNNYVLDPNSANFLSGSDCGLYEVFASTILKTLYPNPKGILKEALNANLGFFYSSTPKEAGCNQVFPFGS